DMPERPAWSEDQPITAGDARAVAELLAAGLGPPLAPELAAQPGQAYPRLGADLERARSLAAANGPLAAADARALIEISLRLQCLLARDDELPPAACLL